MFYHIRKLAVLLFVTYYITHIHIIYDLLIDRYMYIDPLGILCSRIISSSVCLSVLSPSAGVEKNHFYHFGGKGG